MIFDTAFDRLLGIEGGYSNHPADAGGETMWGITVAVARANGYMGPMRDMPKEFAKGVYRAKYWDTVRANELPQSLRYAMFDAAVNSGPEQAIRWLQRAVGAADDGILGPVTLRCLSECNPVAVEKSMLGHRLRFMSALSNWSSFGRGWSNRIAGLLIGTPKEHP